jgi:hypothetical protein
MGRGATHELLDWLTVVGKVRGRQVEYSVGFPTKNNAVTSAITKLPDAAWTAALAADGEVRDSAHVATCRPASPIATPKVGFDYVHSLVDGQSRLAYSEILPDEKGPTCAAFLNRALDHFADPARNACRGCWQLSA